MASSRTHVATPERYYLQGSKRGIPDALFKGGFIFDANVWLCINGPFADDIPGRALAYSSFYKKAIEAGAPVYVPQIVACEFLNRSVLMQAKSAGFDRKCKIHRAEGYDEWIKEACDLLHSVCSDNSRLPDGFDSVDLEACYTLAEQGGLEFHDVLIMRLCETHGCTLVTDDADFSGQAVSVVTWNQRLV